MFTELFIEPGALVSWVYTKDVAPPGGPTDHITWVRTPGPMVDAIIDWWGPGR